MTDFQRRFIVDNNALIGLGRDRRATDWFREHCRIPSEVLHEARGLADLRALDGLEYATTSNVLEQLKVVMTSVPVGDTALVDLFANKGNGDPFVVACALDARAREASVLLAFEWAVVSKDIAVREKCTAFDLPCLQPEEFMAIMDRRPRE